jgi:7-cyano-7-deazaguanine synthase
VVLLSGGLDSTTVLAMARAEKRDCTALSFRYGQRHVVELAAAERIARAYSAEHRVVDVDARAFAGASALTGGGDVPKSGVVEGAIPSTYVPARNTIFLAFALGVAEISGAREIWIGANAVDYSGYPDCRPAFLDAFERMANLATKAAIEGASLQIRAPLVAMAKAEIIAAGTKLGVDYASTWSCYDPQPGPHSPGSSHGSSPLVACGQCDSCRLRKRGFVEANVADPTRYAVG